MLLLLLLPLLTGVQYLLLYCLYYSWPEYAGRSITINHVHDLDLRLSPKRSYWSWHMVLLNPDTSWLILRWESRRSLSVDCHGEWLHAPSLTRGVGARGTRLFLNSCQVVCALWVRALGSAQKHHYRHLGNVMMSLVDVDVSRHQSGTPKRVSLMDYSVYRKMTKLENLLLFSASVHKAAQCRKKVFSSLILYVS